jgi:hypothetical protein
VLAKQHGQEEEVEVQYVEVVGNADGNMDGVEAYAPHVGVDVHAGDAEEDTCTEFPLKHPAEGDVAPAVLEAAEDTGMPLPLVNVVGKIDAPEDGGRRAVGGDARRWLDCTVHWAIEKGGGAAGLGESPLIASSALVEALLESVSNERAKRDIVSWTASSLDRNKR